MFLPKKQITCLKHSEVMIVMKSKNNKSHKKSKLKNRMIIRKQCKAKRKKRKTKRRRRNKKMIKNSKNNRKNKIFKKCLNKWECNIKVAKNNKRNN